MTSDIKGKAAGAGKKIADTAKSAGNKIAEGAEKATDWVKDKVGADKGACGNEKTRADIREHMEVIASCGKHVGVVDHIEGSSVKLTKNDPAAAGKHHFIPMDWIAKVDQHIHLNKNSEEVFKNWKAEPAVS